MKMKENIEDRERKISIGQVLIISRVRDLGDHRVPVSLQLRPSVERLFYRPRQLQVHKVLLEDKMFLIVLSVGEDTRESVGERQVLAWVVDPWSTRYEIV